MDSSVSSKDEIWILARVPSHFNWFLRKNTGVRRTVPPGSTFLHYTTHTELFNRTHYREVFTSLNPTHTICNIATLPVSTPSGTFFIWLSFLHLTIYKSSVRFLNSGIVAKCVLLRNYCFPRPLSLKFYTCANVTLFSWQHRGYPSPPAPPAHTDNTHAYINFPSVTQPTTQLSEP